MGAASGHTGAYVLHTEMALHLAVSIKYYCKLFALWLRGGARGGGVKRWTLGPRGAATREVRSGQDVKCEGFQGRVKSVRACAPHIVTLDGCACVLAVA